MNEKYSNGVTVTFTKEIEELPDDINIRAKASVMFMRDGEVFSFELCSSGVWGVSSTLGDKYIDSLYSEECTQLKELIAAMEAAGFFATIQ